MMMFLSNIIMLWRRSGCGPAARLIEAFADRLIGQDRLDLAGPDAANAVDLGAKWAAGCHMPSGATG